VRALRHHSSLRLSIRKHAQFGVARPYGQAENRFSDAKNIYESGPLFSANRKPAPPGSRRGGATLVIPGLREAKNPE